MKTKLYVLIIVLVLAACNTKPIKDDMRNADKSAAYTECRFEVYDEGIQQKTGNVDAAAKPGRRSCIIGDFPGTTKSMRTGNWVSK